MERLQYLVGEHEDSPMPDKELIMVNQEQSLIDTKFKNSSDKSIY